jgi:alkyldihydroxyacetonephosphate synthase
MRRWNGWGDESVEFVLTPKAETLLAGQIGSGARQTDISLDALVARVPAARLPAHPLITTDAAERVRHARGQSLPDLIAMRTGQGLVFPDGVAYPANTADVRALLGYARETGTRLIPYGGGTSVVGHVNVCPNSAPHLVVDLSRLSRPLQLDPTSQLATFEAGIGGTQLEGWLRAQGYTLGHFPQSFEYSTLGGWIATHSKGQQSLYYGGIERLFAGGQIETPLGEFILPVSISSATGLDLREVVLGSEGRLGIITSATMRISPLPAFESFQALFFPDWEHGVAAIRAVAQARLPLSMVRLSDSMETIVSLALPGQRRDIAAIEWLLRRAGRGDAKCMLLIGATGDAFARQTLRQALGMLRRHGGIQLFGAAFGREWFRSRFRNPYLRNNLWERGFAVDTVETATDWTRLASTKQAIETALRTGLQDSGERVSCFTHLSHVYTSGSSVYTTYVYRVAPDPAETLRRWQVLKAAASRAIVANGATISHQHGVGLDHRPYLAQEKQFLGLRAMRDLLKDFDPDGMLNPGKLLDDATGANDVA